VSQAAIAMPATGLQRRYEALRFRIEELGDIRALVSLPPEHDISRRQWRVVATQLNAAKARLLGRLQRAARAHLAGAEQGKHARALNAAFGEIELELSRAFILFDTYMDVLTQRYTPELGGLLAGCDALAADALFRRHPALSVIEPPLVFCDRGFGASMLREGVKLPDGSTNPLPLIQIPYSRLKEKYNLTSILHEAGHEVMVRLGLIRTLPEAFREGLTRAGASEDLSGYFAVWSKEIGPDFWTFCGSGPAASGGIKEILALPPHQAYQFAWTDPHPPPYIRALLGFDWCRQTWGVGIWDNWEQEWRTLYKLDGVPPGTQRLLEEAVAMVPVVGRILLQTRFRVLNGKTIPQLFNLKALAPAALEVVLAGMRRGAIDLRGLAPCGQLAVFRMLKESGRLNEQQLDRLMSVWLRRLAGIRDLN